MRLSGLVIFAVGAAVGAAFTMAIEFSNPAADAGDWLAFAGVLVGVAISIAGTVWIEDYRSKSDERSKRDLIARCLTELSTGLARASEARGEQEIATARPERVIREEELVATLERFSRATIFAPSRDLNAWQKIEAVERKVAVVLPLVKRELDLIVEHGDSEPVLNINIEKMTEVSKKLRPLIVAALNAVK